LPGSLQIGIFNVNLKDRPDMASNASQPLGERKRMKRLVIALASTAILGVAGCSANNQDQVNNAEMNQPSTDALNLAASDAANDAANAEAEALGQQQQQLENQPTDNAVNPSDAQEQNVSGM
jgi:outer membrane murein-binding lipoprotein Lpp